MSHATARSVERCPACAAPAQAEYAQVRYPDGSAIRVKICAACGRQWDATPGPVSPPFDMDKGSTVVYWDGTPEDKANVLTALLDYLREGYETGEFRVRLTPDSHTDPKG